MRFLRDPFESQDGSRLPIGSLIDVVFLLLVFFLCTMEFRSLEGKLAAFLPKERGGGPVCGLLETVDVRIEVAEEGRRRPNEDPMRPYDAHRDENRFAYEGRRLSYVVGPRRTSELGTLRAWLRDQIAVARRPSGEPRPALLRPGSGVLHEEVVHVLDVAWEVGFAEIVFGSPVGF
jgi:biopolymer transport protein ExbD